MEAAFHGHHAQAPKLAADQAAAMAGGRALWKMRDGFVFERGFFFDLFDEAAETGAEDDAGVGRAFPGLLDEVGGG
jgi:hypothetical protein